MAPRPPSCGADPLEQCGADQRAALNRAEDLAPWGPASSDDEWEAALWAVRRHDGLNSEEEQALRAWLAQDAGHGALLKDKERQWSQLTSHAGTPAPGTSASSPPGPQWKDAPGGGARPRGPDTEPSAAMRPRTAGRVRPALGLLQPAWAAVAVLAVGTGWVAWSHWHQPTFTQQLATQRGQLLSATLLDGSAVQLDTATRLQVSLYRDRRELVLPNGQAEFQVRPDAQRPLHVLAGPVRVTVIGTRFTVRNEEGPSQDRQVQVVVEEGRVEVSSIRSEASAATADPGSEPPLVLQAGDAVRFSPSGRWQRLPAPALPAALAWRTGRIVLDDTTLGQAVQEFERYRDTGLVIQDPATAALRLNGSFEVRQFDAFVRALPQALPVRLLPGPGGQTLISAAH